MILYIKLKGFSTIVKGFKIFMSKSKNTSDVHQKYKNIKAKIIISKNRLSVIFNNKYIHDALISTIPKALKKWTKKGVKKEGLKMFWSLALKKLY